MRTRAIAASFICGLLAIVAVMADEGRIPLFQPTVITTPGHYVLTRDFSITSGIGIDIQTGNVTVDFNGRTLSDPAGIGATSVLVSIGPGATHIVLRNGRLVGGGRGIVSSSTTAAIRLRLEGLEIFNTYEEPITIAKAEFFEMLSCRIIDATPSLDPSVVKVANPGGTFGGRIVDNTLAQANGRALRLDGLHGGVVSGNDIKDTSLAPSGYPGIAITGSGNLVEANTVRTGWGAGLQVSGFDNLIRRNVLTGNEEYGLLVSGDGNHVLDNVVSDNGDGTDGPYGIYVVGSRNLIRGNTVRGTIGDGVRVNGSQNFIDENLIEGNATGVYRCGIRFETAGSNAYKDNMLRGNPEGAVCGSANTDAGGNII